MSEVINNVSRRKEIVKNVLRQLHQGKTIEEVKAEFSSLASQVSYDEIVEIEQMLIDEGLPVEEIQNLCDVHVAFFRDSLDQQAKPETISGHPVFTFRSENEVLLRFLDEMSKTLNKYKVSPEPGILETLRLQMQKLGEFDKHYRRKEYILFPKLEKVGFMGPSKVMWGIHDEVRVKWKELIGMLTASGGVSNDKFEVGFNQVESMMREMVYKEENILYPTSIERLKDSDWEEIQRQEGEIGYFMIMPGNQWKPKEPTAAAQAPNPQPAAYAPSVSPTTFGELPLNTGALTLDQINLMLCNLPVDITFVDEKDTVRFFSQTKERIFERLPAIIGRQVQNCHPPQSVHKVQQILDDFRSGRRDGAEFWIQMMGKFIHIRYFALRDANRSYRGAIEVTQDLGPLRQLEGEKRLMDDTSPN